MLELIYVVDDDRDLRESIAEILNSNGLAAFSYSNAEIALQAVDKEVPALVIVDNMMPGMGGMAFIPILKQRYPHVKVIMITAFSTVDNAVLAMKSGADDYLTKPFRKDELLVAVKRNLEELKFRQELAGPGMDEALACLANQIRRKILHALFANGQMRFMDITRHLEISDHTKVNFHLKNLRDSGLITKTDDKFYALTPQGNEMVECLTLLAKKIPRDR